MTNPSSEHEKRHYRRIPFIAEVVMSINELEWRSVLLDISLKGMLVDSPSDIQPDLNAVYSIELVLGEDVSINMEARISHVNNEHWGMQWENIDIEGLSHLRRLLELNLNDSEEMHREIAELG
ncbi:MAG: PilZ domain-containing protein [Gammaproteobacteria bacterium]|nr:PilZ domain-containing protein [Gammaproteobacteria bacterium]MCW8910130.1 PilZ domain-containing protein [Gammaproteobacteria bacterium]MCW9005027.1 PilZ domain-containing protein [Gammaproteobacteria bacterium]MCW9055075.1 PilZ domain-containing protein [Gammaproteobacteria bacterium]